MNDAHIELLRSSEWRSYLEADLLPWARAQVAFDTDVTELLEIGPGPGLMTDLLSPLVRRLVAIEVDYGLAEALAARFARTNVDVIHGDATRTDFSTGRFTAAVCVTMLHHIPSPTLQNQLFAETHRVLQPGGRLVGVDSLDSPELRAFHIGDTFVPVRLSTLADRLQAAGFAHVTVEEWTAPSRPGAKVRFTATKD